MKTLLLSLFLFQVILVNAQTYEWVNSPEFISDEFELTDIAIDNEGNIFQIAGYENSFVIGTTPIELIGGASDVLLLKYSDAGNHLWSIYFGSDSADFPVKTDLDDADNIYISCAVFGDTTYLFDTTYQNLTKYQIIKFDSEGNFIQTLFLPDYAPIAIANNALYTCYDSSFAKYDLFFNELWEVHATPDIVDFSNFSQLRSDISANENGEIVFTGYEINPDESESFSMGGVSIEFATPFVINEVCIVKADSAGNILWIKTVGSSLSPESSKAYAVTLDNAGNVYAGVWLGDDYSFAGDLLENTISTFGDPAFCAVLKYSASGEELFAKPIYTSSPISTVIYDLAINNESELITAGVYSGDGKIGSIELPLLYNNYFIAKYNPTGSAVFIKTGKSEGSGGEANSIEVNDENEYYFSGIRTGNPGFDCFDTEGTEGCFLTKLTEFPFAYAEFTYTNAEEIYFFVYTGSGALTWFWDFGNGETSVEENPSTVLPDSNIYEVMLVTSNGVCTDTAIQIIDLLNSTHEISVAEFQLYPNPADNFIIINLPHTNIGIIELEIFDLQGNKMISNISFHQKINVLNIENLPAGIYVIKLKSDENYYSAKFVKE